jgi:hypothetical protein
VVKQVHVAARIPPNDDNENFVSPAEAWNLLFRKRPLLESVDPGCSNLRI